MKAFAILRIIAKTLVFVLVGLVLFVCGVVVVLYSPWSQKELLEAARAKFGAWPDGTRIELADFSLRFPLRVNLQGLAITQASDTIIGARNLEVDANPLGFFIGHVSLRCVHLSDGRFRLGTPDSAMYMTIAADSIYLAPAYVTLPDIGINLSRGLIDGGRIAMVLTPDTTPSAPAPPSNLAVRLERMNLRDFEYSLRLMPSIDTLVARVGSGAIENGLVDLANQKVHIGSFGGNRLDVRFISPDSAAIAAFGIVPVAATDSVAAEPWTVSIDSIDFAASKALYAIAGARPLPGLDFSYIEMDEVHLAISDFYNQLTTVRIPLDVSGTERCGVRLHTSGTLDIDSVSLNFRDFELSTAEGSQATFAGTLGMGDLASDPDLPLALTLNSAFEPADIADMFPAAAPLMAGIPVGSPILLDCDVAGTVARLNIADLSARINRCVSLKADGWVGRFMTPEQLEGNLTLDGNIINVGNLKDRLLPEETAAELTIPPMRLRGHVGMQRGVVDGTLAAVTATGDIRMNAHWNSRAEAYNLSASADRFPVQAFLPLLGLENVTADLDVSGHGYSAFLRTTAINATAEINSATYSDTEYSDITATATLEEGQARLHLNSDNSNADFTLDAAGNLDGDAYSWQAELDGRNLDLHALGLVPDPCIVEINADLDADLAPSRNDYRVHLTLNDLYYRQLSGTIVLSGVDAHLNSNDSLTNVNLVNRDLTANFSSPCGIDTLTAHFGRVAELFDGQLRQFDIRPDSLQRALPPFSLSLNAGANNLVNDILAPSDMAVRRLQLYADNDSTLRLNMVARRFSSADMVLDSLFVRGWQTDSVFYLTAGLDNQPGNLDQWHRVRLGGNLRGNRLQLGVDQQNLAGKTGFALGTILTATPDTTITLNIKPYDPTIGYQSWTVNDSNYISVNMPRREIHADLHMHSATSSLAIYTEAPSMPTDSVEFGRQPVGDDLVVRLTDIHIQDWIAFNPWAPPMKGDVSANMRLNRLQGSLVGRGSASIGNFTYGRQRVADMEADFDVSADRSGTLHADVALLVDGVKTITVRGALNDSTLTHPFDLDFSMIRFPLATVNPFLPTGTAKLSGVLNGSMAITGSTDMPIMNGWLDFDSTAVNIAMLGATYTFSEDSIPVRDNMVKFDNYAIKACNNKPLTVDGTVDLADLADVRFDLRLGADGTQLVNSRRAARGADVYGKAFIDLDAKIRGSMSFMSIDAKATVLPETNVTYVLPTAESQIVNRSSDDMVKFVNFTDSLAVLRADSLQASGMMMLIDASLTIDSGSIINVDLNSDGTNKVQLESNGTLDFTMTPMNSGRLTGQLNIDGGFARYGMPPVLSEQLFNFERGSYVAFRGDMMNPSLNIHAVNTVKANVTQAGANSRLVNFNVSLGVTGTLDQMNVAFDLATNDDLSVANELQGMTAEQRANQAMNLMLYHVYTGPGTTASSSLSNPLYSFLAGQLNEWAANTIKGVDVSFGIDQYDRTVGGSTSQTTSYSYQVSKSLFNDRFKIVVGGNYSTDANADENFSQNLINDISFEYFLNRARTMYVKLFRHTGYESILEGEITQTGVGFVYRRKLQRVGDMFLPPALVNRRIERENRRLREAESQTLNEHK